ncbi:MAG: hypothetical protein HYZ29_36520 [Myxococcales bacterium]|nr:hypothetical protein [Myxococcales bacterium]
MDFIIGRTGAVPAPGVTVAGRQIRAAIDAVFWAMQTQEEGRRTLPRLRFAEPLGPLCRISPVPLSAESLRKLSPILDCAENWLLVDARGQLCGVAPYPTAGLGIGATSRGEIVVVDWTGKVTALLQAGEWHHVDGSRTNIALLLRRVFEPSSFKQSFSLASLLLDFALWAKHHERGAAFVVAPDADQLELRCSVGVEDFPALPELEAGYSAQDCDTPSLLATEAHTDRYKAAARVVGAGCGVDGATVLAWPPLQLVGFGAKLPFETVDLEVLAGEVPVGGPAGGFRKVRLKELGGMRHQSAAGLVSRHREATVVTVSQDGAISMFAWLPADGCVVALRNIDRYLAAESLRLQR